MTGKINIVFGFFYLAATAVLGPQLLVPNLGVGTKAFKETAQVVGKVSEGVQANFAGVENPDKVMAPAIVSIFDAMKTSKKHPAVGGHAHGNLEALLNIAVGVVLLNLAISPLFKTVLSLLFIVGALFHSGMLFLGGVFGMFWAYNYTFIGGMSIIAGLVLMGVASVIGIKNEKGRC